MALSDDLLPSYAELGEPRGGAGGSAGPVDYGLELLELLGRYDKLTRALNDAMRSGFLALSRAKYHSNGASFGASSWDQKVQATRRVAGGELVRVDVPGDAGAGSANPANPAGTASPANPAGTASPADDGKPKHPAKPAEPAKAKPARYNPINMFSVCPPTELRNSQKLFEEALAYAAELAKLHAEIQRVEGLIQQAK